MLSLGYQCSVVSKTTLCLPCTIMWGGVGDGVNALLPCNVFIVKCVEFERLAELVLLKPFCFHVMYFIVVQQKESIGF